MKTKRVFDLKNQTMFKILLQLDFNEMSNIAIIKMNGTRISQTMMVTSTYGNGSFSTSSVSKVLGFHFSQHFPSQIAKMVF
jgi:hypothetical protein